MHVFGIKITKTKMPHRQRKSLLMFIQ